MPAPRKHPPKGAAATVQKLAAEGHAQIGIAKQLGVGIRAFRRWLEDDEAMQEAFDQGREQERVYLHSLIVQAAVANKGANSNAMFLLKARHGYREGDQQNVAVSVAVQNVMYVKDHGTDEEWAARTAAQQAKLSLESHSPRPLVPALPAPVASVPEWHGNEQGAGSDPRSTLAI